MDETDTWVGATRRTNPAGDGSRGRRGAEAPARITGRTAPAQAADPRRRPTAPSADGDGRRTTPRQPTRPELPEPMREGRPSPEAAERALVRKPQIGDTRPAPPPSAAEPARRPPARPRPSADAAEAPRAAGARRRAARTRRPSAGARRKRGRRHAARAAARRPAPTPPS